MSTTKREQRQWWAVADGDVREVTGYSCAPANPDMWWCPAVGFSGAAGYHLFETKADAIAKAIAETERGIRSLQKQLDRLNRKQARAEKPEGEK